MSSGGSSARGPLNVIWFVVDSVRNYRSGGDDRDKLDVMDALASECIDFETVVTSAPSTVMSGATMMTGCPAYLIGRDYDSFSYDESAFPSLGQILKRRGYLTEAVMWFLHSRQRLGGKAIDLVDRGFWPRGLKFGRSWTNDEVSHILNRRLDRGLEEPFFLLAWYNCRGDPDTSLKVERDLDRLKEMGALDNSVFVMCSDHGYPDPSRGMGPQWFARQGLTHDLVITDDNILVPLLIRYPGCTPRRVTTPVSTMDLMPTILDLLGVEPSTQEASCIQGQSLVPLMEGRPAPQLQGRKFRSDARFMMQTHRTTAIRGDRHKYIIRHDEAVEELYDLREDPSESQNLIGDSSLSEVVSEFREEFHRSEREAVDSHLRYLLGRSGRLGDLDASVTASVIYNEAIQNGEIILNALPAFLPQARMTLVTNQTVGEWAEQTYDTVVRCEGAVSINGAGGSVPEQGDLVIILTSNRRGASFQSAQDLGRRLTSRRPLVISLDPAGLGAPKRSLGFMWKVAYRRKQMYWHEPALLIRDMRHAITRMRLRKFRPTVSSTP